LQFCVRLALCSALASVVSVGACKDSAGLPGNQAGIQIMDVSTTDTVFATHPLTLLVRDTAGQPFAHAIVLLQSPQFTNPDFPYVTGYRVLVATSESANFVNSLIDTADTGGRLTVQTRFGSSIGTGTLELSVPAQGFANTVLFTVLPGAPAGVTVQPVDTAIYGAHGYTLRGHAVDRFGNPRTEPATFSVAYGPVTVDSVTGAVVASQIGRAAVVGRWTTHTDTAYVSVVPEGWLAVQQYDPSNGGPLGIFLVQLDGSGRQSLTQGLDNSYVSQGFGWSPDGHRLVLARGSDIDTLVPGGVEHSLVHMSASLNISTRFSRDGRWVYFALGGGGLYRVSVDSGTTEALGTAGGDGYPAPSHDGLSVAYVSFRTPCGVQSCIRVLDIATNLDRMYGTQDFLAYGTQVSWSPTADLIAYALGGNLTLVQSDGTGARVLATGFNQIRWIDWSADGSWLVVDGDLGLMLIEVQSGMQLPLGQFRYYSAPAWRP
jgi:hypothetical protein